jgi:hypothetical protein
MGEQPEYLTEVVTQVGGEKKEVSVTAAVAVAVTTCPNYQIETAPRCHWSE